MLRLLADENVRGPVLRGLLRIQSDVDIVRAIDVGLDNTPDPDILEWAAKEGRIVITRDVQTMTGPIYQRIAKGQKMPGAIILRERTSYREQIEGLLIAANASEPYEWENRVEYLPWPKAR